MKERKEENDGSLQQLKENYAHKNKLWKGQNAEELFREDIGKSRKGVINEHGQLITGLSSEKYYSSAV